MFTFDRMLDEGKSILNTWIDAWKFGECYNRHASKFNDFAEHAKLLMMWKWHVDGCG